MRDLPRGEGHVASAIMSEHGCVDQVDVEHLALLSVLRVRRVLGVLATAGSP